MAIKATTKKPLFGNRVSHANNKTRHMQKLNVQKVTIGNQTVTMTAREAKKIKASK
ncbi:MAG: bL28 family ribosomal protein [Bacilli bacterium]|jgi:ribosomal protein L28